MSARLNSTSESVDPWIDGNSDGSIASIRSRRISANPCDHAVVHEQPRPCRNGWQFVCWIAVPVVARTCAMNSGDSTCAASSRRFSSPQAGATLR